MNSDKKKEDNKETESEQTEFKVRPLEYCKPRSLSELMDNKEEDKRVSFS